MHDASGEKGGGCLTPHAHAAIYKRRVKSCWQSSMHLSLFPGLIGGNSCLGVLKASAGRFSIEAKAPMGALGLGRILWEGSGGKEDASRDEMQTGAGASRGA
jgi:hypothetical protein